MHHRNRTPIALILIAAPAAVAIWSGWVGLGGLAGFGVINLLPGIGGGFSLNTAITLPVGVEAYAAYALGVWMSARAPEGARRFAMWSALGALAYGMLGQVVYHLLAASGAGQRAAAGGGAGVVHAGGRARFRGRADSPCSARRRRPPSLSLSRD